MLPGTPHAQSSGGPVLKHYQLDLEGVYSIWDFVQDDRGIIWMAAEDWLVQYDGHSFKRTLWLKPLCLGRTAQGQIFVGGLEEIGYLTTAKNGAVKFQSLRKLASDSSLVRQIRKVFVTPHKVFFSGLYGVFEYDLQQKTMRTYAQPANGGNYRSGFTIGDSLFVHDTNKGLMLISNGTVTLAPHGDYFKGDAVFCAIDWNPKGGKNKIIGWKQLTNYWPSSVSAPTRATFYNGSIIETQSAYALAAMDQKYLFVVYSDNNKGAGIYDANGQNSYQLNDSLRLPAGLNMVGAFTDQQKNFWGGYFYTSGGTITKLEHGKDIHLWSPENGFTSGILSLTSHQGKLYAGTNAGLYVMEGEQLRHVGTNRDEIEGVVSFTLPGVNKLIVATYAGIEELNGEKLTTIVPAVAEHFFLLQSKRNPRRIIASGVTKTISLLYKDGHWMNEGAIEGLNHHGDKMLEEPDGTLWLNQYDFYAGYVRVEMRDDDITHPKSIQVFSTKDGLEEHTGSAFMINNELLIGTNKGIRVFDRQQHNFKPWYGLGRRYALEKEVANVSAISAQDYYIIPFDNPSKIEQLTIKSPGDTVTFSNAFRRIPGNHSIYTTWLNTNDNTLWIGGTGGLTKYDARFDVKDYSQSFSCVIRTIKTNGDSILFTEGLSPADLPQNESLPYNLNGLTFEFAAPFFDREDQTLYSYQLEGVDREWSSWEKVYYKEYTNIPEGTYTFNVKAKNIYNKESSLATYTFSILPPWYRSWWAFSLYAVISGLIFFGLVRLRTHTLNQRQVELSKIVQQQTEELQKNNTELQKTNETLLVAQRQLVTSEKMASLGQLTAGIAHEINNPINFISGGVQALSELHQEILDHRKEFTVDQLEERRQEINELTDAITNGVHRTAGIIKSLREFSSPVDTIGAGASASLEESIENSLVLVHTKIKHNKVNVVREFSSIAPARANSSQLSQVLVNLIDNAVHAVCQRATDRQIRVATRQEGDTVVAIISDNGPGIPPENQTKIFEPFFTTKEVGTGTGLGLFICYSIIKRHDGSISFTTSSAGTEFVVRLPKAI